MDQSSSGKSQMMQSLVPFAANRPAVPATTNGSSSRDAASEGYQAESNGGDELKLSKEKGSFRTRRPFSSGAAENSGSPTVKQNSEGKAKIAEDDLGIVSFRNATYDSVEMQRLLSLNAPEEKVLTSLDDVTYKPALVFPDWVLQNQNWKLASLATASSTSISDILKTHFSKRSPEQVSTAIHWLMSVWKIAYTMGFKRCGAMLKEFKLESYQPDENIITEGERGLTFYIIIEGKTAVHKEGIGIVGYLGKGKSFGEIALTQGKDLRTATITALSAVDVVCLHKTNYEYFVRDIQDSEKRENFRILSECKLFNTWPKGKIEKMLNSCVRKTFDAGQYVFHQGDPPNDLCIMVEGSVEIVKELVIVCKNRWPVAVNRWKELKKSIHKPILLKTLHSSDFFGEMAILKDMPRSTSAIAATRTVLLSLDRLEFLHLISYGSSNINGNAVQEEENRFNEIINKYINDQDILDAVSYFKGGPDSEAVVGNTKVLKNELQASKEADELLAGSDTRMSRPTSRNHSNSNSRSNSLSNNMHRSNSGQRRGKRPSAAAAAAAQQERERDNSFQYSDEISRIAKGQDLVKQLQKTARDVLNSERLKEQRAEALVGTNYSSNDPSAAALHKQQSRFGLARGTSTRGFSAGVDASKRRSVGFSSSNNAATAAAIVAGDSSLASATSNSSHSRSHSNNNGNNNSNNNRGSDRRIRGYSASSYNNISSNSFHRGSIYDVSSRRTSNIRFSPQRPSLAGVDNDPRLLLQGADCRVLLRKNSAIALGTVYQEVYRQLQHESNHIEQDPSVLRDDRRQSALMVDSISRHFIDTQLTHRGNVSGNRQQLSPLHATTATTATHISPMSPPRSLSPTARSQQQQQHSNIRFGDQKEQHHSSLEHHSGRMYGVASNSSDHSNNYSIYHSSDTRVAPIPQGLNASALTQSPFQGSKSHLQHHQQHHSSGFNSGGQAILRSHFAYSHEEDMDNNSNTHSNNNNCEDDNSIMSGSRSIDSHKGRSHQKQQQRQKQNPIKQKFGGVKRSNAPSTGATGAADSSHNNSNSGPRRGLKYLNKAKISYRDAMEG